MTAIDITTEDLIPRLHVGNVTDLVLVSMMLLPNTMPSIFQSTYTPVSEAGTPAQIRHLARLLATQLTAQNLGKGIEEMQNKAAQASEPAGPDVVRPIRTLLGGTTQVDLVKEEPTAVLSSALSRRPPPRSGIRPFRLAEVAEPISPDVSYRMMMASVERVIDAEKTFSNAGLSHVRCRMLASLATMIGGDVANMLHSYVFEDTRSRSEIAFDWLYREYAEMKNYVTDSGLFRRDLHKYEQCLVRMLNALHAKGDHKDGLFARLMLEAPLLTENAVHALKNYCADETRAATGMTTVRDLIMTRPACRELYLEILLQFTHHDKPEIRNAAVAVIKKLYAEADLTAAIERYASMMLGHLKEIRPSEILFRGCRMTGPIPEIWPEELVRACCFLYLSLLPINHSLIHLLSEVYSASTNEVKRCVLRLIENAIPALDMNNNDFLNAIENCSELAGSLFTRIIAKLTEKQFPSELIVDRVRTQYKKHGDPRCLIPVMNGLQKKEIIATLPKLLKYRADVIKEAFNKLFLSKYVGFEKMQSPISPAELLIAIHQLDLTKSDVKSVIAASSLCFAERDIYKPEVLAIVMQQLMEINPLPTLFMRTVLQSLSLYPQLIGFVMNIMQRLIVKQVWKQKKVWEGFIKCCQKTMPQSFHVLLQLPPPQLKEVFTLAPDLQMPLREHIGMLTQGQRDHIPPSIMAVIEMGHGPQYMYDMTTSSIRVMEPN